MGLVVRGIFVSAFLMEVEVDVEWRDAEQT